MTLLLGTIALHAAWKKRKGGERAGGKPMNVLIHCCNLKYMPRYGDTSVTHVIHTLPRMFLTASAIAFVASFARYNSAVSTRGCGTRSMALSRSCFIQSVGNDLNLRRLPFSKIVAPYTVSFMWCIMLCLGGIIWADAEMVFCQNASVDQASRLGCPPQVRPAVARQADDSTIAIQDEVCRVLLYACKTWYPHQNKYEYSLSQHHRLLL